MKPVLLVRSLLASAALLAAPYHLMAANETWSGSTNLTWNTSTSNWTGSTWTAGNDAFFNGTGTGNIVVSGTEIVGTGTDSAITFNATGYDLTGGTLQLPGSANGATTTTIQVNANAEIDSTISNGNPSTGTSNSVLTVTSTNGSILTLNPTGTDTTGSLQVLGGSTVDLTGGIFTTSVAGSSGAAGLILSNGTLTVAGGTFNTSGITFVKGGGNLNVSSGTFNDGTATSSNLIIAYGGSSAATLSGTGIIETYSLRVSMTGAGTFNLNGGTLEMNNFAADSGTSGTFNFNGGSIEALGTNATFTPTSGAPTYEVLGGGAAINTNGFNISFNAPLLNGVAGTDGGLTKSGAGTLTLGSTNTYTGNTSVTAGTLNVTGSTSSSSAVSVSGTGATLVGTGTVGGSVGITNGTISAGTVGTIGTLNTGALTLSSASTFDLDLNSLSLTSDLVNVTGNVALGSAALLAFDLNNTAVNSSHVFDILNFSGTLSGTFSGLADGSDLTIGSNNYQINYGTLDANEVTLEAVAAPEPGTVALMLGGLGLLFASRRISRMMRGEL